MNEKTARSRRKVGQAVTIQAVATQANVSAMTVSHVLNGTKRVRDETRDAVLAGRYGNIRLHGLQSNMNPQQEWATARQALAMDREKLFSLRTH